MPRPEEPSATKLTRDKGSHSAPWPWLHDADLSARPRWHHWLMAAAILFATGLIVPIIAPFV